MFATHNIVKSARSLILLEGSPALQTESSVPAPRANSQQPKPQDGTRLPLSPAVAQQQQSSGISPSPPTPLLSRSSECDIPPMTATTLNFFYVTAGNLRLHYFRIDKIYTADLTFLG